MLLIPVPPLPEQHRIVAEVERRLSVADEVVAAVAANLGRVPGRLRPADAQARRSRGGWWRRMRSDEPAEVLLAHIQTARTSVGA